VTDGIAADGAEQRRQGKALARIEHKVDELTRLLSILVKSLAEDEETPELTDLDGLTHGTERNSLESLDGPPGQGDPFGFGSPLGGSAPARAPSGVDAVSPAGRRLDEASSSLRLRDSL